MPIIYQILDNEKSINFNRKIYTTPCSITVKNLQENEILKQKLKEKNIKKYKVEQTKLKTKKRTKVELGCGDGKVLLKSVI